MGIRRARVTAMPQRPEGEFGRKCDRTTVHREDRSKQMNRSVTWQDKSLNRDLKNFGCEMAKHSLNTDLTLCCSRTI
ncbi:hypothetical protein EMIT0P100_20753 [Pseudomonas sp. IT-P100]